MTLHKTVPTRTENVCAAFVVEPNEFTAQTKDEIWEGPGQAVRDVRVAGIVSLGFAWEMLLSQRFLESTSFDLDVVRCEFCPSNEGLSLPYGELCQVR